MDLLANIFIRHIPSSQIIKRWCKDAKSKALLLLPQPSDNQKELFEMSRYGFLNSDANMMNYYASKVESLQDCISQKVLNDQHKSNHPRYISY